MQTKKIKTPVLNETICETRLDNGLRIISLPKERFQKRHAIFATRFGALNNCFRLGGKKTSRHLPDGVAHFLEHRLFEGAEGKVSDRFSELGASANAFTSHTVTAYVFTTTQEFEKCLDLLLSFVQTPIFTKESVERERGIIAQEIAMYDDVADYVIYRRLVEAMYHRHPARVDIGGTKESLKKITPALLRECHRTFYQPANMALICSGDIDHAEVARLAKAKTANWKNSARFTLEYPDEPDTLAQTFTSKRMSVALPKILFGFKGHKINRKGLADFTEELAALILLDLIFGSCSRFFEELYRDNLIDNTFSVEHRREADFSFTALGGDTKSPNELRRRLLAHLDEIRASGLDREDFLRKKRKAVGKFITSFDSIEGICHILLSCYIKEITINDYWDTLNKISLEQVFAQLDRLFRRERMAESLILPQKMESSDSPTVAVGKNHAKKPRKKMK